jgi:hypothetical protein
MIIQTHNAYTGDVALLILIKKFSNHTSSIHLWDLEVLLKLWTLILLVHAWMLAPICDLGVENLVALARLLDGHLLVVSCMLYVG